VCELGGKVERSFSLLPKAVGRKQVVYSKQSFLSDTMICF